jgi:hypothetical protein
MLKRVDLKGTDEPKLPIMTETRSDLDVSSAEGIFAWV